MNSELNFWFSRIPPLQIRTTQSLQDVFSLNPPAFVRGVGSKSTSVAPVTKRKPSPYDGIESSQKKLESSKTLSLSSIATISISSLSQQHLSQPPILSMESEPLKNNPPAKHSTLVSSSSSGCNASSDDFQICSRSDISSKLNQETIDLVEEDDIEIVSLICPYLMTRMKDPVIVGECAKRHPHKAYSRNAFEYFLDRSKQTGKRFRCPHCGDRVNGVSTLSFCVSIAKILETVPASIERVYALGGSFFYDSQGTLPILIGGVQIRSVPVFDNCVLTKSANSDKDLSSGKSDLDNGEHVENGDDSLDNLEVYDISEDNIIEKNIIEQSKHPSLYATNGVKRTGIMKFYRNNKQSLRKLKSSEKIIHSAIEKYGKYRNTGKGTTRDLEKDLHEFYQRMARLFEEEFGQLVRDTKV